METKFANNMKCPECGLVNFATATECKRCHLSFESGSSFDAQPDNYNYWPQADAKLQNTNPLFSGVVVVLTGILVVAGVVLLLQQAFHPFDPETAKGVGAVFALIGVLLTLLTHIWLLIRIFEQSVGWGLASFFFPVVGLVAVGKFWDKTKRSFIGQILCMGIAFVGFGIGA